MIGSFWNLCRACPSMPVDKLHSEYRSTYRWHEFTGNSRPEVVRRPPVPNQFGPVHEPPLPRRKKCPELAYKSHEFIIGSEHTAGEARHEIKSNRARSEERGTPSRRSKSEGPPAVPNGRAYPISSEVDGTGIGNTTAQPGESSGLFKKTISKLSTEYRLQFVWPHVRRTSKGQGLTNDGVEIPKKSQSMGAIKSSQTNALPTVHKKRTTNQKEATLHELEPLVSDAEDRKPTEKQVTILERKSNRPFSQTIDQERLNHFLTRKENFGFEELKVKTAAAGVEEIDNKHAGMNGNGPYGEQWYKDVIELRKKAGEYKSRGWGGEIDPEFQKKQKELWDQVSKRSSLSALSLASSVHRPITKEEKEQENNKKSYPTKSLKSRVPGQAHSVDNKDEAILPTRFNAVRHHLERTTGPDVEEGALLPSPTREKLMPAITKRESESQRGSPKKSASSRHGSPQKGSPQKGSPKKTIKARSQSVGPGVENESPKRQMRSTSTAPAAVAKMATKKTPVSTPTSTTNTVERKPRPSTLSTTTQSRTKSSSLPPSGRAHSVPGNHHIQIPQTDTIKTSPQYLNRKIASKASSKPPRPKSTTYATPATNSSHNLTTNSDGLTMTNGDLKPESIVHLSPKGQDDRKLAEHDGEVGDKDGPISISSCSPQPVPEFAEPIVKSPPEPTRVKSPEQIIIMRSPDPVNWTVPLDTGKTFTVTQNVKEGEIYSRPQSEIKASTPVEKPPPAPQSAPPELTEQAKMDAWKPSEHSDSKSSITTSPTGGAATLKPISGRYDKPVPGSTLRCLDDPTFDVDTSTSSSAGTARNTATDVLEKARDRFDRFWGGNKEDNV